MFTLFTAKPKYLLTLQEGDPIEYIERTVRPAWPFFVRAFTRADAIQAISNFLGAWAKRRGFTGDLSIIPNAVNTRHFSEVYSERELAPVVEKLGKKKGNVFLITTSRLVTKNAVDDVIRALALMPEHIHFAILGIGPDEAMLQALAAEKGVAHRTHFLGQVGHSEMPKYLKACDIFIRPSRSEGMGNSFVEAMAAELPVIATQEGGIADFLFDPVLNPDREPTGRAVPKDDPVAIAHQVEAYLADKELTARIIANAKRLAFQKYDWDIIAKDMQSLFKRLLG
jgi:glycosyltransferase involved in cell wall biosynthesis